MKSIMDAIRRNTAEQSLFAIAMMTDIPIVEYVSEYRHNRPFSAEDYYLHREETYKEWVNGAYNYAKQRYDEDVKNGKKFNKSILAMSIEEFIEASNIAKNINNREGDAKIESM